MSDIQNDKMSHADLSVELVREIVKERRCDRRWRNLRFFAGFLLFVIVIYNIFALGPSESNNLPGEGNGYVALVRLEGTIAPSGGISAEDVVPELRAAFSDKHAKGVIIDINSGGGTPVQASIIHDEIVKLKKKYNKKVIVVGEDLMASGAYFIAVSADKIYVNPNTITGSIGVLMEGFGANAAIEKLGIDRRVFTAGDHKDRLDPFLPANPDDIAKIRTVLSEVHQNFSEVVTRGRQGKLQGDTKDLFSGDFWTGQTALKLGLVDGLGDLWDVMQNEFQTSHFKNYGGTSNLLKSLMNQMGSALNLPLPGETMRLFAKL